MPYLTEIRKVKKVVNRCFINIILVLANQFYLKIFCSFSINIAGSGNVYIFLTSESIKQKKTSFQNKNIVVLNYV